MRVVLEDGFPASIQLERRNVADIVERGDELTVIGESDVDEQVGCRYDNLPQQQGVSLAARQIHTLDDTFGTLDFRSQVGHVAPP